MKNQKTTFKIPDSYFEQLTEKVMSNVETQELKSSKRSFPSWIMYASAAAILIFVITFVSLKTQNEELVVNNTDSISQINDSNMIDEDVFFVDNQSETLLTHDVVDNDLIDWSNSMDFDDEEFYLVINYF